MTPIKTPGLVNPTWPAKVSFMTVISISNCLNFCCDISLTILFIEFHGCQYGPDPVWHVIWPNTPSGTTSIQPCPGGVDSVGKLR